MKILFCGGGALGSHALCMARDLRHELSVIDCDRVETKNLASQWFVKQMVGKNKANALKLQLQNFFGLKLSDYTTKLTELNAETILSTAGLIVDCFDNAEGRSLIQGFARANGVACVHGGLAANGEFGVVRWDKDFVIDEEDVPGQATCEGGGFLPIINTVSAALVASIQSFTNDAKSFNWNISPNGSERF